MKSGSGIQEKEERAGAVNKNDDDAPGEFDALLRVSKIFENFERIQKLNEELEKSKDLMESKRRIWDNARR